MVVCVIKWLGGCVAGVEAGESKQEAEGMSSGDDRELLQVELPAAAEEAAGEKQLEWQCKFVHRRKSDGETDWWMKKLM